MEMSEEEVILALNEEIDDLYKMIEEKDKRFDNLSRSYIHLLGKLNEAYAQIENMRNKHIDKLIQYDEKVPYFFVDSDLIGIKSPGVYAVKEGCHILEVCTPFIDGTITPEYMQAKKII